MQKNQNHRDLKVFQKAYKISIEIYEKSKTFPEEEKFSLTSQIRRASTGICANIAEGYGRQLTSDKDFKRFLIIAKGSCLEMSVWIDYCRDFGLIDKTTWESWNNAYDEISRMLFGLIKRLEE